MDSPGDAGMAAALSLDYLQRLADQVAEACPAPELEHAAGYCPFTEGAELIRPFQGARLLPDAVDRLACWLWTQQAGGNSAWPYAGETLRQPFVEAAEDILALITARAAQ